MSGEEKPTVTVPLPEPTPSTPRTVTVRRLIGTHGQPDLIEAEYSDGSLVKAEVWPEEPTP